MAVGGPWQFDDGLRLHLHAEAAAERHEERAGLVVPAGRAQGGYPTAGERLVDVVRLCERFQARQHRLVLPELELAVGE